MASEELNKVIFSFIMISLMGVGFIGLFNLGANITPALDVSFSNMNGLIDIFWTLILRLAVAPILIVGSPWIIFKVWTTY